MNLLNTFGKQFFFNIILLKITVKTNVTLVLIPYGYGKGIVVFGGKSSIRQYNYATPGHLERSVKFETFPMYYVLKRKMYF